MCCKQTEQARLNYKIVPKRKKKFISKALPVALKKDLRLSRLYSDLEICWANFKTLSRIQVAARALTIGFMRKTTVPYVHHFFGTFLWHSLRAFSPCKEGRDLHLFLAASRLALSHAEKTPRKSSGTRVLRSSNFAAYLNPSFPVLLLSSEPAKSIK